MTSPTASTDRPIFIVGCPRSGTTLFRTMLHAHPRIAVPPETRFVMPAYQRRFAFGDLTDEGNREQLARWIVDEPETRFRVLGLDRDDIVRQIVAGPPTVGSALGIVFRAYSESHGKPRWGDKRPAYYSFIDELDELFPDAQFLHVVRDGRACFSSLKKKPWFGHEPIPCMATWMMAVDCSRESGARIGADRFYELRYEDLVADPEKQLRAVCDFLAEEFEPAMCEPEKIAEKVNPKHYEQREQISKGIYTGAVEAWRDELEPWEVATFEQVAGARLRSYGYELSGIGGAPPADKVSELENEYQRLRHSLTKRRRRNRAAHLVEDDRPVSALLTDGQRAAAARRRRPHPLPRKLRRAARRFARSVVPMPARRRIRAATSTSGHADHRVEAIDET